MGTTGKPTVLSSGERGGRRPFLLTGQRAGRWWETDAEITGISGVESPRPPDHRSATPKGGCHVPGHNT